MTSALPSLVTILSAIAVLLVEADDALDPDNKIIGGKEVDIVTVPWQVSLTVTSISFFFCGGTIISERWIVSAAHCFDDVDTSDVTVRVGSNLHAAGGQTYQLEQVIGHEEFHSCKNDIALLKTTKPMIFDKTVAKARLPAKGEAPPSVGTKLLVSGWGDTDISDNRTYPEKLMAVEIEVVKFSKCESEITTFEPVEALHVCAGSKGRDSCQRDSGGPLVNGNLLVGIVSCGEECGIHPGIYTKVSMFRDWIKKNAAV